MDWTRGLHLSFLIMLVLIGCRPPVAQEDLLPIEKAILNDRNGFYATDFVPYASDMRDFAIGVFDSGTGGLTVLDAILRHDEFSNSDGAHTPDGIPDFATERFIYLADQANMPYGNYHAENKSGLLVEHIIKDVQFLLSNKYYRDQHSNKWEDNKQHVKVIVIACNTATAYGKDRIESFIRNTGAGVHVIGVIDAGARGALEVFDNNESGSIGVLATVGTVASRGYERAIERQIIESGFTGDIRVFNQGGYGIAEAVDEVAGFIDPAATSPYENYLGPSIHDSVYTIDKALLDIYNFDMTGVLCDSRNTDDCNIMQLNSSANYMRFHVVSLLEKIRMSPGTPPLKALLLGCTHYPYLTKEIETLLSELYDYKKDGQYVYRDVMAPRIAIIDPAVNVAAELHGYLEEKALWSRNNDMNNSEFYISVPNVLNPLVKTDDAGQFTYEYKYGRNEGDIQEYVKVVPFSARNISGETISRLKEMVPLTLSLINTFNQRNTKTKFLRDSVELGYPLVIQ